MRLQPAGRHDWVLIGREDHKTAEADAKRLEMTDCVIQTLSALPEGQQRKIVEGKDLEEQENLFGQVVDENHAQWRQTIAKECGHIATDS